MKTYFYQFLLGIFKLQIKDNNTIFFFVFINSKCYNIHSVFLQQYFSLKADIYSSVNDKLK